jgi:hypothetical protein
MKPKKPDPEHIDQDNPELTREELRRARPAAEILPEHVSDRYAPFHTKVIAANLSDRLYFCLCRQGVQGMTG